MPPDYFTKMLEDNLKTVIKPQYVDKVPKAIRGSVRAVEAILKTRSQTDQFNRIMDELRMCLCWFVPLIHAKTNS